MINRSPARRILIATSLLLLGCGGGSGGAGGHGGTAGAAGKGGSGASGRSGAGGTAGVSGTGGTGGGGSGGTAAGAGGTAGGGGAAGTGGGSGGTSGATGRGGSGGTAGSATAGSGGTAGAAGRGGSGGTAGAAGRGGTAGSATAGSGGTAGAAGRGGSGGTAGASGAAGAASPIAVSVPSFTVATQTESTQCVVLDLGNTAALHIGEIKTTLSPAVYEVRIGATTSQAVQTTPSPCTPFADINDRTVTPLVLARNATDDVVFPAGVGYTFVAHQLIRVEVHGWNATAAALDASVNVTFTPMPDASYQQEGGLLLWDEVDIDILPGSTATTVTPGLLTWFAGPTASVFRVMGYTHELGINVLMRTATSLTDPSPTTIYSPAWDPTKPPVVIETPPVVLTQQRGLILTCSWNHTGATEVRSGTSLNDERCASVFYYYPAMSPHRCLHSSPNGGTIILCCPGSACGN